MEYNGQTTNVVHIFANPLEENTPDPANIPNDMIYIGPGVYKSDAIPVTSGKTVYIAGGAVVYGNIRASHVENVTIRGRGIISGDIYPRTKASEFTIPFEIRHSKNVTLEGLTFLDSAGWTINAYFLDGLEINNIKIVTARANGDGISLQSCQKRFCQTYSFVAVGTTLWLSKTMTGELRKTFALKKLRFGTIWLKAWKSVMRLMAII